MFSGSRDYFSFGTDTANTFGDRYATIQPTCEGRICYICPKVYTL